MAGTTAPGATAGTTTVNFTDSEGEVVTGTPPPAVATAELPIPMVVGLAVVGLGLLYVMTSKGK